MAEIKQRVLVWVAVGLAFFGLIAGMAFSVEDYEIINLINNTVDVFEYLNPLYFVEGVSGVNMTSDGENLFINANGSIVINGNPVNITNLTWEFSANQYWEDTGTVLQPVSTASQSVYIDENITVGGTLTVGSSTNHGIVLDGDGMGADIAFGDSQDFIIDGDSTYLNLKQVSGTNIIRFDGTGNMDINPSGFDGGGKITAKAKTNTDDIETIYSAQLERSGGSGGNGLGLEYLFRMEDGSAAEFEDAGAFQYVWNSSTDDNEYSDFNLITQCGGSMTDAMRINCNETQINSEKVIVNNIILKSSINYENQVVCYTKNGLLGHCVSIVNATGGCKCVEN